MKRKKKKAKKAAFDMEAFEKELDEGSAGKGAAGGSGATDCKGDLGDDPFANEDGADGERVKADIETWHGTDRDYTYQEVSTLFSALKLHGCVCGADRSSQMLVIRVPSSLGASSMSFERRILHSRGTRKSTPLCLLRSHEMALRRRPLPTSSISARGCIVNPTTSFNISSPSWERWDPSTDLRGSLSRVVSSQSRSRMSSGDTLSSTSHARRASRPTRCSSRRTEFTL